MISIASFSQEDKKFIRKGNREYKKENFSESEILYRKASDESNNSPEATFNIGDALYKQHKFEDAGKQFVDNTTQTVDAGKQAAGWYNLGNSLLQANKVKESIDAYKNSLKLDPGNTAAKYNLGYAQNLLKKQEEQQKQQQQQQQNKQDDQQKQDQQDKNNQDKQDKNENQQPQAQQNQQEQQKQDEQEQGISKEDAERLLNALANDEKAVQEKVKREKAAKARTRTLKNW
ncbi:MAG: tetratricopeptide repeat protein [Chloroflexota bacterium]